MSHEDELTAEPEGGTDSDIAAELSEAFAEEPDVDSAATSFLEVEDELDGPIDGAQIRGRAVDVDRVSGSEVPEDYPVEIRGEDALALYLERSGTDGGTVVTYFEWPDEGADGRLAKLLDLRDVPGDRFADLHGERILLEARNGHYVPLLPGEEPRGDARGLYGVLAALGVNVFLALAMMFGFSGVVASTGFLILWLVANVVVLPVATYLDAWNLRTRTDWDGGPLFWAALSAIPAVNIAVAAFYLISRGNAEPIV